MSIQKLFDYLVLLIFSIKDHHEFTVRKARAEDA